VLVNVVVPAV